MNLGSVHVPTLLATAVFVIGLIAIFMFVKKKFL